MSHRHLNGILAEDKTKQLGMQRYKLDSDWRGRLNETIHMNPGAVGLLLILGIAVIWVAPAFAQAQVVASPVAQATAAAVVTPKSAVPESPKGVEEIVVTAQKRAQLSQDVPIALTVLTAPQIEFRRINDMTDLMRQVPGLQYGMDTVGDQQIFIRGIGVDDASGSIESPIATYIDGVYQTHTFRAPILGIDLDRIEVLKGPQGTLFGRNATGGAINTILKPPTDELTGTVQVGGGSYGQTQTQMSVSGPLIKQVLDARVSYAFEHDNGWVVNDLTGKAVNDHLRNNGRVALSFHPLETLAIDYDFLAGKVVGGGVNSPNVNILMGTPAMQIANFGRVVPPKNYLSGNTPWEGKFDGPVFEGDKEDTQNALNAKWDLAPWASLRSITAFTEHTIDKAKTDNDGTASPLIFYNGKNFDDKTFSQEFNLGGNRPLFKWGDLSWLVGAYYLNEDYASDFGPYDLFFNELSGVARGHEQTNSYSIFGDTTIPLPWHLSVFGGVRFTYDRKSLKQSLALRSGTNGPYLHIPGSTCDGSFVDNFHNLSPRVGMGWAPFESLNVYVKYSEGYNAGGHYFEACNNAYKPETLGTVEGGVKGRWFDGRLTAEASGFWNDFKDFQIFQVNSSFSTALINAPKATMYGGELAVTAIPVENLSVNLGLSLMHSEYNNFFDADPENPGAGLQNLSGHQMERSPNHTEQVGLEYDLPIPWNSILNDSSRRFLALGPLRLRGEWYHTDYIPLRPFGGNDFGGKWDRQSNYSIFNFYASLPIKDGKWTLDFFAKNFTNTKYFDYILATTWGQRIGVGGMPPWFGGDVTYHF